MSDTPTDIESFLQQALEPLLVINTPAPGGPSCCGCGVSTHDETIPLFEGQVLPPTWAGTWTRAAACASCAARQQVLLHPVTLMAFRHMGKDST